MLFALSALFLISIPIYCLYRVLQGFARKKKELLKIKIMDVYVSVLLYLLLLFGFFLNRSSVNAGVPLRIFQMNGAKVNGYASLANEYILTVIVLLILGLISFWIISLNQSSLPPIVYVLCSTLVLATIIFAAVYLTHTLFTSSGEEFTVPLLQISFGSLLILYVARLKDSLDHFYQNYHGDEIQEDKKVIRLFSRIFFRYQKISRVWAIALFPILIIIQFIMVLFGQRPDSFIRVFLDTSSFHYSNIPAPAPEVVEGDGHYLCTVSAMGHKKLVKPLRAGIRKNSRIVVNRQLLVANAFENILEQYTPNCHKEIRQCYNRYGYPISKHIQSKWSADIVYLLIKPLEWTFLIVLYTVDRKPENRIHI